MNSPVDIVRQQVIGILSRRSSVIKMACQQRAKFEGWLKFELAVALSQQGNFEQIILESGYPQGGRSDFSFLFSKQQWFAEMKTANTNWRAEGLANITRPIKLNIDEIIDDIHVLQQKSPPSKGMAIFLLFPIPMRIWKVETEKLTYHLRRIENEGELQNTSLFKLANFTNITDQYGLCSFVVGII